MDIFGNEDTGTAAKTQTPKTNGVLEMIVDYTRSMAYRPNDELATAGALAFLSLCCARRYRDKSNSRSPLYIFGLGDSGIGKQAARSTNQVLANKIGLTDHVVGNFRSGEALEDAILTRARLLSQFDEVDTLFNMLKDGKNALSEVMMGKMLDLWSDQGGYTKRRLLAMNVGNSKVKVPNICYHPGLCIYGTAVTKRFYEAISDRMSTNGLFARLMIVEAGARGARQPVVWHEPPEELVDVLAEIAGRPVSQALKFDANEPDWKDTGIVVDRNKDADEAYRAFEKEADGYYDPHEDGADNSLWSRAAEKLSKVALIMAVSRDPHNPCPMENGDDMKEAKDFVWKATKLSLRMLKRFSYETDFQKNANKVKEQIISHGGVIEHSKLLRNMHMRSQDFMELMNTMIETGEINPEGIDDKRKTPSRYLKGDRF